MYTLEQMHSILNNPASMAEAAANLAQNYLTQFGRLSRGEADVDLRKMHEINNQLTAVVIAQGQHVFLNLTISSIQKAQEELEAKLEAELANPEVIPATVVIQGNEELSAVANASSTPSSNVVQLQLNQLHQQPDATQ